MLLGHESSGRVVALGPDVDDLALGQRVVLTFIPRCGPCDACRTEGRIPCTRGTAAHGPGTMLDGHVHLSECGHPVLHPLGVSAFEAPLVYNPRSRVPVGAD